MYSFSNDTSFSDFYNFPEDDEEEENLDLTGDDKLSNKSKNSMEEAAK